MIYEQMLKNNIEIYKNWHNQNKNILKYPNEYLIRLYHCYLRHNIQTGGTVLDFGFGCGNNSIFFLELGYKVFGIEISPSTRKLLINNLNEKKLNTSHADNFIIIDSDFLNLPYETGMFDLIFSNLVLYYYPSRESIQLICEELKRCLKPEGIVVLTMCGTKSSIMLDATSTIHENVYKVAGHGFRSALDGQYLYLVPDEQCLEKLFSTYEKVNIGYTEEELLGRKDFTWIFIGKNSTGT